MTGYLSPFGFLGILVFFMIGMIQWLYERYILVHFDFPHSNSFKRLLKHPHSNFRWVGFWIFTMYRFFFYTSNTIGTFILWYEPFRIGQDIHFEYNDLTQQQMYISYISFYIATAFLSPLWVDLWVNEVEDGATKDVSIVRRPNLLGALLLMIFLFVSAIAMAVFSYWVDHVTAILYTINAVFYTFLLWCCIETYHFSFDSSKYNENDNISNYDYFYNTMKNKF